MNHWVMDYETLSDCFLGVFEHYKTDEVKVFTVGKLRNNLKAFLEFLDTNIAKKEWHISFNGLSFDSQITQFILKERNQLLSLSGVVVAQRIYEEAQAAIKKGNDREFAKYSEKNLSIKQIDVFKLNHWDNPAKRSSLKWIECSMDWHNVQDMPIDHRTSITTVDQLKEIASYCRNDVAATKKIMQLSSKQITLRANLSKEYKVNLHSASEPRISKELFMHFLSKKTGASKYELRNLRTFRNSIIVKDILLPYLDFQGVPEFENLLENFKKLTINPNETKGGFKYSIKYKGLKSDFGLGGVHAAKRGIYESDDLNIIMSSDVVSYYPNLAIRNNWSPAQFKKETFNVLYEWFFDERRLIPKSDPRNYVYKIILNSTYGLSNDKNSFLYDPEFTMRITINGQLSLMMLYVMLTENIPGAIPLMQNTDGLEMRIPRKYKQKYLDICKQWETITKLQLEHDTYAKLIIPDVNNYIGIFEAQELTKDEFYKMQSKAPENQYSKQNKKYYMSKTKCKGRFEFKNRALHKNKSFTVIPKAVFNYFVHGVDPNAYLKNNKNIFDYCGQTKARGDWDFHHLRMGPKLDSQYNDYTDSDKEKYLKANGWEQSWANDNWVRSSAVNREAITGRPLDKAFFVAAADKAQLSDILQKTLRYYISKKGGKIVKHNRLDNRDIQTESGKWLQVLFNTYEEHPFEEYNIDPLFYLIKIRKEIELLEPDAFSTQLSLTL